MKDKYRNAFMRMAFEFAKTSEAVRRKVGALIVKDGNIIALGVNGMPPGWPTEDCEIKWYKDFLQEINPRQLEDSEFPYEDSDGRYKLVTKPECRHAEIAALEKLWHSSEKSDGAEMYVTTCPCLPCAIKIKTAKISAVYYCSDYRNDDGLQYLSKSGIMVERFIEELL